MENQSSWCKSIDKIFKNTNMNAIVSILSVTCDQIASVDPEGEDNHNRQQYLNSSLLKDKVPLLDRFCCINSSEPVIRSSSHPTLQRSPIIVFPNSSIDIPSQSPFQNAPLNLNLDIFDKNTHRPTTFLNVTIAIDSYNDDGVSQNSNAIMGASAFCIVSIFLWKVCRHSMSIFAVTPGSDVEEVVNPSQYEHVE